MDELVKKEYLKLAVKVFPVLTKKQALPVLFFFIFGRDEAARQLGISVNTVKSSVRRARVTLRRREGDELESYFLRRLLESLK
ncbi:sigma factor-like helix-turn-helix DNA-binding protein [Vibrio sp. TBV020]|uniref:sigma factor-like helix-turn-helix DNA-binding protein n=1 Tax=Vibrio sp. TBV020 TaxID=3137398 RepID=UPI0038CDA2B4